MKKTSKEAVPKTVDEYLARVPEPARESLNKVRAAIRSAVPKEATESISYRMPMFKYRGMLVGFAAFSDHCSLFPGRLSALEGVEEDLKTLDTSDGTIRFAMNKPLPAALVKRIVRARVAANERKAALKKSK